ncbi:MAG: ThuA domain-containing protein [Verrucomicrobiales bacterium]|nr:ThuA domain-containing protein [Verrucomicrobiales bacterium]
MKPTIALLLAAAALSLNAAPIRVVLWDEQQPAQKQDALKTLPESERAAAQVEWTGPFVRKAPKRDDPLTPSFTVAKNPEGRTVLKMVRPNCCFHAWREDGEPSRVKVLLPEHPIARGLPGQFTIAATEMYTEPFHVPAPDAVVLEEYFVGGEHFRSGVVWQVGKGKVFYFRPGHETYKVFFEAYPLQIIENAVRWLGKSP